MGDVLRGGGCAIGAGDQGLDSRQETAGISQIWGLQLGSIGGECVIDRVVGSLLS
jgi:hypothetical protein